MQKYYFWILIFIILFTRLYFRFYTPKPYGDGDTIRITATVRSEPIRYETAQYLKIEGLKVYLPLYPEIFYGDKVILEGVVEKGRLIKPKLVKKQVSTGFVYKTRQKLLEFYNSSLPEPHASFVAGVVVGSKSSIPAYFWEDLKKTGTAHVVVASGMNVTLVAGFLIQFFTIFLKRRWAIIATLGGVWSYSILSGFDAPIVRAAIMGSIAFIAQELGRMNFSLRALLFSAILMLIISPNYISDLGFWMSVLATLGIILFAFGIERLIGKLRILKGKDIIRRTIVTDLSTSLAAQAGVLPILYYFFGQLNIFSPFINMLVLWTVVPVTLIGMIAGIIGIIYQPAGTGILMLSYPLTWWFVNIVEIFS